MSGAPERPARLVNCPRCGVPAAYSPANPWRPFCSERCRQIDLGAWASEAYRIPLKAEHPDTPATDSDGDEGPGSGTPR
ncbi:MAG: DNA gyrase inhibitor YacG [Betaproteobacteria bacterium]|nr:DNA gyrase inhibitor YacG [Betaproteobacteria bacterium]